MVDKEGTEGGSHPRTRLGKKAGLGGFLPNTTSIPATQIIFEAVRGNIESWKEKSLIGKFVGIWTKEKDLIKWINNMWNPKGQCNL